ncbi:MAG: Cellulose-binding protein [Myxococcales bacterium]|nr:Cellulose-binding protein [Myxococcales bacterium]
MMALAALVFGALGGGCGGDTVLRLTVLPGVVPRPTALRITVTGGGIVAAPLRVSPVALPGTVVVHGLGAAASRICVAVEGLDASDTLVSQGSTTVTLARDHTTAGEVTLGAPTSALPCESVDSDLGVPGGDLGDLAGKDAAAPCPAGATFCDDFESADTSRWTLVDIKRDLGTELTVQSARVYQGSRALEVVATGTVGVENYAVVQKNFPPTAPPFAVRTMFYSVQNLSHFTMVMSVYDGSTHGFSMGGDSDTAWVITEDQAVVPDHHSDMATSDGGRWHCLEMVADAGGNVTGFVDDKPLIGPFARVSAVQYTNLAIGIGRIVVPDVDVFFDDVAIGPARLYCP